MIRDNEELKHYGILGMRWGVRRYQNEDGSLKPAGEKRYNSLREAKTEQIKQETAGEYKQNVKYDNRVTRDLANKAAIVGNAARIADKDVDKAVKRHKDEKTINALKETQKALHEQYDLLESDLKKAHSEAREAYGDKNVKDLEYRKNGYIKGSGWYNSVNNWRIGARYNTMANNNATRNRQVRNFLTGNYQERYNDFTSRWNGRDSNNSRASRDLINNFLSESVRSLYDQNTRNAVS